VKVANAAVIRFSLTPKAGHLLTMTNLRAGWRAGVNTAAVGIVMVEEVQSIADAF
jgi:hypothetical protein